LQIDNQNNNNKIIKDDLLYIKQNTINNETNFNLTNKIKDNNSNINYNNLFNEQEKSPDSIENNIEKNNDNSKMKKIRFNIEGKQLGDKEFCN